MSKRQFAERPTGDRVAVRQGRIYTGSGQADIYDLVIPAGKGRKRAEALRRKVEEACREILEAEFGDA